MQQALPKTILVPTDFSDAAREALHRAVDVAEACSAKLTVLYADPFSPPPEVADDDLAGRVEQSRQAASEHLQDEVRQQVPSNIQVDALVVADNPVAAILNVAKEKNVDWIVMGTHGRSGVRRLVLGSVTESVLRQADRPVLTVHAA